MIKICPCSNTPDSNELVIIQLCRSLLMTIHLNQVCWSWETSKTCRAAFPDNNRLQQRSSKKRNHRYFLGAFPKHDRKEYANICAFKNYTFSRDTCIWERPVKLRFVVQWILRSTQAYDALGKRSPGQGCPEDQGWGPLAQTTSVLIEKRQNTIVIDLNQTKMSSVFVD